MNASLAISKRPIIAFGPNKRQRVLEEVQEPDAELHELTSESNSRDHSEELVDDAAFPLALSRPRAHSEEIIDSDSDERHLITPDISPPPSLGVAESRCSALLYQKALSQKAGTQRMFVLRASDAPAASGLTTNSFRVMRNTARGEENMPVSPAQRNSSSFAQLLQQFSATHDTQTFGDRKKQKGGLVERFYRITEGDTERKQSALLDQGHSAVSVQQRPKAPFLRESSMVLLEDASPTQRTSFFSQAKVEHDSAVLRCCIQRVIGSFVLACTEQRVVLLNVDQLSPVSVQALRPGDCVTLRKLANQQSALCNPRIDASLCSMLALLGASVCSSVARYTTALCCSDTMVEHTGERVSVIEAPILCGASATLVAQRVCVDGTLLALYDESETSCNGVHTLLLALEETTVQVKLLRECAVRVHEFQVGKRYLLRDVHAQPGVSQVELQIDRFGSVVQLDQQPEPCRNLNPLFEVLNIRIVRILAALWEIPFACNVCFSPLSELPWSIESQSAQMYCCESCGDVRSPIFSAPISVLLESNRATKIASLEARFIAHALRFRFSDKCTSAQFDPGEELQALIGREIAALALQTSGGHDYRLLDVAPQQSAS
jgi:hypothetical protein